MLLNRWTLHSEDGNGNPWLLVFFLLVIGILLYTQVFRKGRFNGFRIGSFLMNDSNDGSLKDIDNKIIQFYHNLLTKYVAYYRNLNRPQRRKFIDRLHEMIESMDFKGESGQQINLKVSALCCAPAIQITFGLDHYLFRRFHTIVVYPQKFYSESLRAYVKGGVSDGDAIFFSYEDLLKGYEIPNDALNVGLHEMAHAMHMEQLDEDFERRFPTWVRVAESEVIRMRSQKDPILRNYAGQNRHELFAVCVETFFEQGDEMKKQAPGLYNAMCDLLNQDPVNRPDRVGY